MRSGTILIVLSVALIGCSATAPGARTRSAAQADPPAAASASTAADGAVADRPSSSPTAALAIPNAREPLPGVITGGMPSDENLSAAKALGFKTVVSLLPATEAGNEAERAERLHLGFVSIPIAGPDDLTEEHAKTLAAVLADPARRPLILHCASGNRAGALLALEAFYVEHVPAPAALELGIEAGLTKLRPVVEARLGIAPAPSQ